MKTKPLTWNYAAGTGTDPTERPVKCRWCEFRVSYDKLGSHCGAKHRTIRKAWLNERDRLDAYVESLERVTGPVGIDHGPAVGYTAKPRYTAPSPWIHAD